MENVDQADGVSRTRLIYTDNKFRVAVFVKEQKQKKNMKPSQIKILIFLSSISVCCCVWGYRPCLKSLSTSTRLHYLIFS